LHGFVHGIASSLIHEVKVSQVSPVKERLVMAGEVTVGQTFKADDGGIEVMVLRVGSRNEKARFRIENLSAKRASYTITVHRQSGAEPDRIKYDTDNPHNPGEYELSADETTSVEIRLEEPDPQRNQTPG
jgi:hypothetical protein